MSHTHYDSRQEAREDEEDIDPNEEPDVDEVLCMLLEKRQSEARQQVRKALAVYFSGLKVTSPELEEVEYVRGDAERAPEEPLAMVEAVILRSIPSGWDVVHLSDEESRDILTRLSRWEQWTEY